MIFLDNGICFLIYIKKSLTLKLYKMIWGICTENSKICRIKNRQGFWLIKLEVKINHIHTHKHLMAKTVETLNYQALFKILGI
jgi:hypothetical protein